MANYKDRDRQIMAYLAKHPDSIAGDIAEKTGVPIASVNYQLWRFCKGNHENPLYEISGHTETGGGRYARLWRLAAEDVATARRRLRKLAVEVRKIVRQHPDLAQEAVAMVGKAVSSPQRKK